MKEQDNTTTPNKEEDDEENSSIQAKNSKNQKQTNEFKTNTWNRALLKALETTQNQQN